MTNIITISAVYSCTGGATVDLSPHTWADVKEWFVKWDTLHVLFERGTEWVEYELDTDPSEGIDWKRPTSVDIYDDADELVGGKS